MHPMLFGTTNNYGVYTLKQHDLSFPNIFLVLKSSNFNYLKSSYGDYKCFIPMSNCENFSKRDTKYQRNL